MAYVWAAYKMGAFGQFKEGLTVQEFGNIVLDTAKELFNQKGDLYILIGGGKPCALVTVTMAQLQWWPHCTWFPWATARNKIECALRFFVLIKEHVNCVITSLPDTVDFFGHLCRYGVLRRIGTGRGWLGDTDVVLFETVRQNRV